MRDGPVMEAHPYVRAVAFQQQAPASSLFTGGLAAKLACLSLVCAWITAVVHVETSTIGWAWDGRPFLVEQKNFIYYACHLLGVLSALSSGVLSFWRRKQNALRLEVVVAFVVLFLSAILWAICAYSQEDFFSTKLLGATGPFVWFSVILLCAGMDPEAWPAIHFTMKILAYASVVGAIRAILTEVGYYHYVGLSRTLQYTILLIWCGGWTLLNIRKEQGPARWLSVIPILVAIPVSLYAQSRSWMVVAILLGVVFWLGVPSRTTIRHVLPRLVAAILGICILGAALYGIAAKVFPEAVDRFEARLYEDSRSQQYVEFFSDVHWPELILGRGPEGTWYWRGMGEYQFIDNQYLWMAFMGGLPLLLSYCSLIILPAVRVLWGCAPLEVASAAWLLVFWALAFGGLGTFVSPSLSLPSYLLCLCAGRCWEWLSQETV